MANRDITVVIDRVADRIKRVPNYSPSSHKELYFVLMQLGRLKESCMFTAPEAMHMRWVQFSDLMEEHVVHNVTNELLEDLMEIFQGG